MVPLHRPWIGAPEEDAILRVLRTGRLAGNGAECAALERELSERLGTTVLATSSATQALELGLRLMDLDGAEVILPSFTFPSVANAVLIAGGRITFCDIREPDLNADLDHARALVGGSTRALIVTHYAGHPQQVPEFPVAVVEDASHALGSRIDGRACGTAGVFGCLSFHATKTIVAGEGGALLTRDDDAARRARIFREKGTNRDDFLAGRVDRYSWVGLGSSLVMPELGAAIARAQMAQLDGILEARRRIARWYDEGFAALEREGLLRIVRPIQGCSSYHIYAVLIDSTTRDDVVRFMARAGIEVASHFVPLHSSPYGRTLSGGVALPVTDRVAASILRLPIYPGLATGDAEKVVDALHAALGVCHSH